MPGPHRPARLTKSLSSRFRWRATEETYHALISGQLSHVHMCMHTHTETERDKRETDRQTGQPGALQLHLTLRRP